MRDPFDTPAAGRAGAPGPAGSRGKAAGALVVAPALGLALVDAVVLRGETVARTTARLDGTPATLALTRVGEPHTLEITKRRRVRGETEGRAIAWRIEGPDGTLLEQGSELVRHERRYLDLTPAGAGEHTVTLEENGRLLGASTRSASVRALVGDRRILARRFSLF